VTAIFLSASVPVHGRKGYDSANPFLIQCAVREFAVAVLREYTIVWGGHPAITPMIWAVCEDLGVNYAKSVVLYQSKFFEGRYPEENAGFQNVIYTEAVSNDVKASLLAMRKEMLGRPDLSAAVFVGGMEGIEDEFDIFQASHPGALVLPVPAPGGVARDLAKRLKAFDDESMDDIDFVRLFHARIPLKKTRPAPGGS
jgi:hypothetical protein